MTKKIAFTVALALVLVGIAAPSASAVCNPPKFASTYNGTTGAFIGTFVAAGSGGLSGPWGFVFRSAPPLTCADDCLEVLEYPQ